MPTRFNTENLYHQRRIGWHGSFELNKGSSKVNGDDLEFRFRLGLQRISVGGWRSKVR